MHERRRFTLIELLVVIAIVALLMGILMPALQRVHKQARAVYCLSNLKHLGIAMQAYALDNDDFVPRALDNKVTWILVFHSLSGQRIHQYSGLSGGGRVSKCTHMVLIPAGFISVNVLNSSRIFAG